MCQRHRVLAVKARDWACEKVGDTGQAAAVPAVEPEFIRVDFVVAPAIPDQTLGLLDVRRGNFNGTHGRRHRHRRWRARRRGGRRHTHMILAFGSSRAVDIAPAAFPGTTRRARPATVDVSFVAVLNAVRTGNGGGRRRRG